LINKGKRVEGRRVRKRAKMAVLDKVRMIDRERGRRR